MEAAQLSHTCVGCGAAEVRIEARSGALDELRLRCEVCGRGWHQALHHWRESPERAACGADAVHAPERCRYRRFESDPRKVTCLGCAAALLQRLGQAPLPDWRPLAALPEDGYAL